MSRAGARVCASPRGVLGAALVLFVVVVTTLEVATPARATAAATEVEPTDPADPTEPTGNTPDPGASCEVALRRSAQTVVCVMGGMAPNGAAGITVIPFDDAASPGPFIGGTTVGEGGTARLEVEVPCGVAGPSDVEVAGPTVDGGRFRHVEPVELVGRCRHAWQLTTREWSVVLATSVLVVAASVLAVLLRRRRRSSRRRRSVREGLAGPRSRTRRGAGRRRSPRRRRHRPRR